jgi:hypothetical protein
MNNLGLLVDYIKQYELGLNQTMLDGDITEEYAYYFERLKKFQYYTQTLITKDI